MDTAVGTIVDMGRADVPIDAHRSGARSSRPTRSETGVRAPSFGKIFPKNSGSEHFLVQSPSGKTTRQKGLDPLAHLPGRICRWASNGFANIDQKCALTPN
jgi:hypothetical protein